MDTLLVAVTALSLLIVLVLAVIVARLLRDERRRSEARVAALVSLSAQSEAERTAEPVRAAVEPVRAAPERGMPPAAPERRAKPARTTVMAATAERAAFGEFELQPSSPVASAPLFVQPEGSSAWKPRVAIVVPLALILLAAGIAFYPSEGEIGAPEPAPAAATAAQPSASLELLSLKHAQAPDSLTVTGLVQNPKTGARVSHVFATAFAFAADGTSLASGRAPLDFTTLGPGDESPFVVTVPVKGEVARYRVGFRDADGRVVAHVDRRTGGVVARVNE